MVHRLQGCKEHIFVSSLVFPWRRQTGTLQTVPLLTPSPACVSVVAAVLSVCSGQDQGSSILAALLRLDGRLLNQLDGGGPLLAVRSRTARQRQARPAAPPCPRRTPAGRAGRRAAAGRPGGLRRVRLAARGRRQRSGRPQRPGIAAILPSSDRPGVVLPLRQTGERLLHVLESSRGHQVQQSPG